jgi:hypothetical protein
MSPHSIRRTLGAGEVVEHAHGAGYCKSLKLIVFGSLTEASVLRDSWSNDRDGTSRCEDSSHFLLRIPCKLVLLDSRRTVMAFRSKNMRSAKIQVMMKDGKRRTCSVSGLACHWCCRPPN